MRQCRLNFAEHRYDCEAGVIGEHNATELIITPPAIMPEEAVYRLCFEPGGLSEIILQTTDGVFSYPLPASVTAEPYCCVTLIGYVGSEQIYKSRMVQLHFCRSAEGDTSIDPRQPSIVNEINANTAARHTHANKDVLDRLSDADGKLQFDGKEISGGGGGAVDSVNGKTGAVVLSAEDIKVDTETTVAEMLQQHEDDILSVGEFVDEINDAVENITPGGIGAQPAVIQHSYSTAQVSVTLADNAEYRLTNVTNLTLTYPEGDFECWMRVTFAASGTVTVTLPAGTGYIGTAPDFKSGEIWELSFKDKIMAAQKVGDGA